MDLGPVASILKGLNEPSTLQCHALASHYKAKEKVQNAPFFLALLIFYATFAHSTINRNKRFNNYNLPYTS